MPVASRAMCWCLIILSQFISGCSSPEDGSIRMGLSSMPVTLDPRFTTDAAGTRINRLIYQSLSDFDSRNFPVPALASWVKLSSRHYRFHIDPDAHEFHNGGKPSAQDVKATYDSVLDPETGSPHRASFSMISRIEVVDPGTVDFFLGKKDLMFPGRLTLGVMPHELLEKKHDFSHHPVGSGHFVFREWASHDELKLERRSDQVVFRFIHVSDPTVRALKLLRGEVDMLQNDLPPELLSYLEQQDGITLARGRGSNFTYLGFNLEDPITGNHLLRKAVAHAIDRQAIMGTLMGGAARPANALLPPDHWAGAPGLSGFEYNPEKARELVAELEKAQGKPIEITYKTSGDPFRIRIATVIQDQLEKAGIHVSIRSYDWGTFYGDIKAGKFQMYSLSWVGIKDPDIFRYIFHSSSIPPQGANRGRFIDTEIDALIEHAEQGEGYPEKAALYRQIQEQILEKLPYVPLWYEDHVYVSRASVSGYQLAVDGNYDGLHTVRKAHHVSGKVAGHGS